MSFNRIEQKKKRHMRLRRRISGTAERPRMSICVTNKHMYVQFIDDAAGSTLASASTLKGIKANLEGAKSLGAAAALDDLVAAVHENDAFVEIVALLARTAVGLVSHYSASCADVSAAGLTEIFSPFSTADSTIAAMRPV